MGLAMTPQTLTPSNFGQGENTYLSGNHFIGMMIVALAFHGLVFGGLYMWPDEDVVEVPVRSLNLKLGGGPEYGEAQPQTVSPEDILGSVMNAPQMSPLVEQLDSLQELEAVDVADKPVVGVAEKPIAPKVSAPKTQNLADVDWPALNEKARPKHLPRTQPKPDVPKPLKKAQPKPLAKEVPKSAPVKPKPTERLVMKKELVKQLPPPPQLKKQVEEAKKKAESKPKPLTKESLKDALAPPSQVELAKRVDVPHPKRYKIGDSPRVATALPEHTLRLPDVVPTAPGQKMVRGVQSPAIAPHPTQYVRTNTSSEGIPTGGTVRSTPRQAPAHPAETSGAEQNAGAGDRKVDAAAIRARYEQTISNWIARHKVYPAGALLLGQHGKVIIRLRIDRQGNVKYSGVEKSSGYKLIDRAAIDMVRRANPVPPVPTNYPAGSLLEFLIPASFDLQ